MNAYYNEHEISKNTLEDKATSAACSLIDILTNRTLLTVLKAAVIAIVLFCFVAVIGMIDSGSIGYIFGIGICALLSAVEIIVIGSMVKRRD